MTDAAGFAVGGRLHSRMTGAARRGPNASSGRMASPMSAARSAAMARRLFTEVTFDGGRDA